MENADELGLFHHFDIGCYCPLSGFVLFSMYYASQGRYFGRIKNQKSCFSSAFLTSTLDMLSSDPCLNYYNSNDSQIRTSCKASSIYYNSNDGPKH